MSDEIMLKDMYKPLINQIREKCLISNEEEKSFIAKKDGLVMYKKSSK